MLLFVQLIKHCLHLQFSEIRNKLSHIFLILVRCSAVMFLFLRNESPFLD
jgi:hypothetical protein